MQWQYLLYLRPSKFGFKVMVIQFFRKFPNSVKIFLFGNAVKDEVLHIVKEERNNLHTMKRRKAHSMGHKLPSKTHY